MSMNQLNTLLKFETDNERKSAQALQQAELDYQQNLNRLQSVSDYRLEYMKRLETRSQVGIDSATYSHFHAFIAKLDNASEQVEIAIRQAQALVDKRKTEWFLQRQKLKAVEHLINKRKLASAKVADKQEQKMFDEIATQQFIRSRF